MTVYEQELRKLFEHSDLVDRPQFSGRVCVGDLGKDLRVRAEFLSTHISSQYDAIRLTVLNRTEGVVDRTLLRFQDVWGKKQVPNNPNFRSGVIPYLWDDYGKVEWYAYQGKRYHFCRVAAADRCGAWTAAGAPERRAKGRQGQDKRYLYRRTDRDTGHSGSGTAAAGAESIHGGTRAQSCPMAGRAKASRIAPPNQDGTSLTFRQGR